MESDLSKRTKWLTVLVAEEYKKKKKAMTKACDTAEN